MAVTINPIPNTKTVTSDLYKPAMAKNARKAKVATMPPKTERIFMAKLDWLSPSFSYSSSMAFSS